MSRIAFFGLGVMGRPMARNLLAAGHEVMAFRHGGRDDPEFRALGGRLAHSVAEASSEADFAITVLPDAPEVRTVALGPDGVIANLPAHALYADMSTIAPQVSRDIWKVGRDSGIRVLDAPVSGGEAGAIAASLSIMVGGLSEDFDAAAEIFGALGKTIRLVGEPGAGQTVKAANQLIVAGNIQLLAEAIVFLDKSGVNATEALAVIGGGLAGSTVLERRGPTMLARNFAPGFRVDLHFKDLGILTDAARDAGVPLPLGGMVTQLMASLRAVGGGDLDHTGLLALMEMIAGGGNDLVRAESLPAAAMPLA